MAILDCRQSGRDNRHNLLSCFRKHHCHSHPYPGATSALDTYNKLASSVGRYCVCNYVPIAKDDRVIGIGVRRDLGRPFNLLIQTEKSGDIVVGSHNKAFKHNCFVHITPLMLVYQQPKRWDSTKGLGFVGTHSAGEPAKKNRKKRLSCEQVRA